MKRSNYALLLVVVFALLPVVAKADWTTEVGGTYLHNEGPLVIDLDGDGMMELLVSTPTSIKIFGADGEEWENMELEIVDELPADPYDEPTNGEDDSHYRIRSTAAGGDINGDGHPDVVVGTWAYFVDNTHNFYLFKLYCWIGNFQNGELTGFTRYIYGNNNALGNFTTPALYDLDRDGDFEIILCGSGNLPNSRSNLARIRTFDFSQQEIVALGSEVDGNNNSILNTERFAIGDIDANGTAEIAYISHGGVVATYGLWCRSISTAGIIGDVLEGFPVGLRRLEWGQSFTYYRAGGITLVDLDQNGTLEILVPVDHVWDSAEPSTIFTTIFIFNHEGGDDNGWGPLDYFPKEDNLTVFTPDMQVWSGTPAIFDYADDGLIDVAFTTSPQDGNGEGNMYVCERNPQGEWIFRDGWEDGNPPSGEHTGKYSPSVADVVTEFEGVDLVLFEDMDDQNENGEGQLRAYSAADGDDVPEDIGGRSTYGGASSIYYIRSTSPAIGYFDSDANLDIAYFTESNLCFVERANINPGIENIEWSQLGNGPRHTGLYAQPYQGWLPDGTTYWRDRVIVTDDVWIGETEFPVHDVWLTIEDNTVVEFNDEVHLEITGGDADHLSLGRHIVFKPNAGNADRYYIDYNFLSGYLPNVDDRFINAEVSIGAGSEVGFENCTFIGDGTGSAITATDAEVTFTNCTFENYATALDLDNCTGTIQGCTFTDMTGHAINITDCLSSGSPTLTFDSCTVTGSDGAAMFIYNSNPLIDDCVITGNNGGAYGAAVYAYNSSPKFRDNNISGSVYAGFNSAGGGTPSFSSGSTSDPHRNRFADNNTYSHTVKSSWTWAQFTQQSPTYVSVDKGHNDFVSSNGDYLISNYGYTSGYKLTAKYNYWSISGSLDNGDFSPSGSVTYSIPDTSANYIASEEEEEVAFALFTEAEQLADSGRVGEAVGVFRRIVGEFGGTSAALGSMRKVFDLGIGAGMSRSELTSYFARIGGEIPSTDLQYYSDRLANLSLIAAGGVEEAIERYEAALEGELPQTEDLYYSIDYVYAQIAQLDGVGNVDGSNQKKAEVDALRGKLNGLFAKLNGIKIDGEEGLVPTTTTIVGCYPNPFNRTTRITYSLPSYGHVSLCLYNLSGQEVARLIDEDLQPGVHSVDVNAGELASGLYFVRLKAGTKTMTQKVILVK